VEKRIVTAWHGTPVRRPVPWRCGRLSYAFGISPPDGFPRSPYASKLNTGRRTLLREADMDMLVGMIQFACIAGLLYGLFLSITYVGPKAPRAHGRKQTPSRFEYDPLITDAMRRS
jgi:hypothetical protein